MATPNPYYSCPLCANRKFYVRYEDVAAGVAEPKEYPCSRCNQAYRRASKQASSGRHNAKRHKPDKR